MTISKHTVPAKNRATWLLPVAVFGFLWFILINQLRVLWALEPQYSYGWAVPFLCAYLVWQKIANHRPPTTDKGLPRNTEFPSCRNQICGDN